MYFKIVSGWIGKRRAFLFFSIAVGLTGLAWLVGQAGFRAETDLAVSVRPEPTLRAEEAVVAKVIDGDSVEIEGGPSAGSGQVQQVRYIGIDAPEWDENPEAAARSTARNRELVDGKKVRLEKDISETDQYGRLLRYVWIGERMVNEVLVREGLAQAAAFPPDLKYEARFLEAEREAKGDKSESPTPEVFRKINNEVPFTAQAPLAEWDDPRQQDGCEEASALMAIAWARGERLGGKEENRDKIVTLSDWQNERFGPGHDTSAADTIKRIFNGYFDFENAWEKEAGGVNEIVRELMAGRLVITPMDGRALGNPYYTAPGPERHMIVITGYDPGKGEFVTNDPGTRRGEGYRYKVNVFWEAIRDYPTGDKVPIERMEKRMIVVSRG